MLCTVTKIPWRMSISFFYIRYDMFLRHCTMFILFRIHPLLLAQALAVMYSMRSREYDVAGATSTSPPTMPPPTVHIERSEANSPSVFTSKHVSVKAGKETYISRIVGGEVFLLYTR